KVMAETWPVWTLKNARLVDRILNISWKTGSP
ncbi:hypothetical protein, partial [Acinetobacter variabilis]